MSIKTFQHSLQVLRSELIPAADRLCRLVEDLGSNVPDGVPGEDAEQFSWDLEKLQKEAPAFREGIEEWFADAHFKEGESADVMRKSRHDARNQLNHLFGTIQLMQMLPCSPDFIERSREIVGVLESCLSLVSGSAAIAEEKE